MPEICRFYGIIIKMYFREHNPPHFHAEYGEFKAEFTITPITLLVGFLPKKANELVLEWATIHQNELLLNWERAQQFENLEKLLPLL